MNTPRHHSAAFSRPTRRPRIRGFTIIEVAVSMTLLAMVMVGTLAALVQSRRVTEGSIFQNSATTIVQGYVEQIKNMEFSALPYYNSSGTLVAGSGSTVNEIATRLDDVTPDPLLISSGSPPTLSNIIPGGTTPNGVIDNLKSININQTTSTNDDLHLKLWVWVQDISDSSIGATQVRAITIIYQWQFATGSSTRWFIGTVRTIRSAVTTF